MRRLLKHSFSVAGAAISVAAAVIAPAAHADLVNNGDFSAGGSSLVSPIPGWNTSALLPGALGGIWGVQCTPPSPCNFFDADTAPPTDSLSQQITTVAGTVYKVSFGLNTDATGTGEFSALFGTRVLTDLVNPGPTGGFQQLSFTAMATAGTTPLLFNFNSFGQTAVENVSVAAVPEPQTLALFGIGFLVLLSAGKRSRSPWPAGIRRKAAAASALLVCASVAHAGGPCPQGAPAPCTWYVQANGTTSPTGDGGSGSPFNTLSQVQAASNPGDTIMVLPAPTIMGPLDMGISLQPGQTLRGAGPPVVMPTPVPPLLYPLPEYPVITTLPTSVPTSSGASSLPWITNMSATGNTGTGDAVDLAANTTVENLVIGGPNNPVYRGGIYGINVPGNI